MMVSFGTETLPLLRLSPRFQGEHPRNRHKGAAQASDYKARAKHYCV